MKPQRLITFHFLVLFLISVQTLMASDGKQRIYIDPSVKGSFKNLERNRELQLVTHGRPGALLIKGEWRNAEKIALFLKSQVLTSKYQIHHINIYGCEFAKGEKGKAAVAYLQKAMGVTISASDDITGKNGDWTLEAGKPASILGMEDYTFDLQCPVATAANDTDGDGVPDSVDVDDDNDGISDIIEGVTMTANAIANGNFGTDGSSGGNLTDWSTNGSGSNDWFAQGGGAIASEDGTEGLNLYQPTVTFKTSTTPATATFSVNIKGSDALNVPENEAWGKISFWIDGTAGLVKLFTVFNPVGLASASSSIIDINSTVVQNLAVNGDYTSRSIAAGGYSNILVTVNTSQLANTGWILVQRNNGVSSSPNEHIGRDDFFIDDISYTYELGTDTDDDGIFNHLDLDSDNDGIPDAIEACPANEASLGANCRYPDGANVVNGCEDGSTDFSCTNPSNTDASSETSSTMLPDYLDLDSDGDGCSDAIEARTNKRGTTTYTVNTSTTSYTVDNATADGLTDAGCKKPANTDWRNSTVNGCYILNADVNVTWMSQSVDGSIAHNDTKPMGASYGTPVASSANPTGGTITMNSNGTYTFSSSTVGVYTYEVPVCASGQTTGCATETLTIIVEDINQSNNNPVANTDLATTTSGTAVTLCTLCNDRKGVNTKALDSTSVTVTLSGGGTTSNGGTVSINATTGNITYTPSASFTGTDTYQYTVENKDGTTATATQVITVFSTGINTNSASDDYGQGLKDNEVSGSVMGNDVDADGDAQTVSFSSTTQTGGSISYSATTGEYTFTPTTGFTGTAAFPYTVSDGQGNTANATLYITVYPETTSTNTVLPVVLGNISAWIKNGILQVSWETLKEENVSHFEIEASADGKIFNKIGAVKSKAANGCSDIRIQYQQNISLNDMAVMGISIFLLSIGAMFRRRKYLTVLLLIAGIGGLLYGCSRNNDALLEKDQKMYIRIKQIDKDGSISYSKTIKVIVK